MNTKRSNEITVAVAVIALTAALVSGALTVRSASAAPVKKNVAAKKAKRVVKVKMTGSRRAAMNRAESMNRVVVVTPTQQGDGQSVAASNSTNAPTEAYGDPTRLPGNVLGTPLQPDPQMNNPIGVTNVPGVVNTFGASPFALYSPPVVNTGNGFVPLYGTGYNMNGYTAAPFNSGFSPYGGFANNPNYLYGATNFGY